MTAYSNAVAAMIGTLVTGPRGSITPEIVASVVQAVTDALLAELTADETSIASKLSIASNLSDVASAIAALDNLSVHGADIASASTLNLSAATGDIIDVTGATSITAVTLSEGKRRWVRFADALTLTNGASLVLPTGANITTAAGDYALFVGYAASVVRCAAYIPASGQPLAATATGKLLVAASTAAAARASGILNIDAIRNNIGDADGTLVAADRVVATSAALTAPRTWTLPAANALNPGQCLVVSDLVGGVSSTNTLAILRAGTDTVNGGTSVVIRAAYGAVLLWSDGISKWIAEPVGSANGVSSFNSRNGPVSLTAADVTAVLQSGAFRNVLINSGGRFNIRAPASNANNTYGHDRWVALTQTSTIAVSTVTDAENGTPRMWRLTQSQATAQRMGYAQWVEGANCKHLRGKQVTLSGRINFSLNASIRYAVCEWTGSEDTLGSARDPVNSWTNGTFTAGNFFKSTTFNVLGVGAITPAAATLTDLAALTVTVGNSANNILVFIWTEGAAAQNATLDGAVQLEAGAVASVREYRPVAVEQMLCDRYAQLNVRTFGQFAAATTVNFAFGWRSKMFATPSATIINAASAVEEINTAFRDASSVSLSGDTSSGNLSVTTTTSGTTGNRAFLSIGAVRFEAEL